jgi:hypothetical protein
MSLYFCDIDPIFTKFVIYLSSIVDAMNVNVIDKNALSFIMGQIVAMETGVIATVSLRLFRYLTGTFICGLHT